MGGLTPPSEETNQLSTPGTIFTNKLMDENATLPLALWCSLQGRLVDRNAPVRARAAFSIESSLKQTKKIPEGIHQSLLASLRTRASKDEAATVRKAAIGAMTQVLLVKPDWLSERDIATLSELTHDNSTLTRKGAAESLTLLVEHWYLAGKSKPDKKLHT